MLPLLFNLRHIGIWRRFITSSELLGSEHQVNFRVILSVEHREFRGADVAEGGGLSGLGRMQRSKLELEQRQQEIERITFVATAAVLDLL